MREKVFEWHAQGILKMLPFWLHPTIVASINAGQTPFVHIVAVTDRTVRKCLLGNSPSPKILRRLISAHGAAVQPRLPRQVVSLFAQRTQRLRQAAPADLVIDWVRTSLDLKSIRSNCKTAGKYARIFTRTGTETLAQLLARTDTVEYNVMHVANIVPKEMPNILFEKENLF